VTNETAQPTNVGSNDQLGGSVPKRDTSGPRGTYGCACAHHDGSMCAWIRYGGDGPEDPCECLCHGWPEDEDDYLG